MVNEKTIKDLNLLAPDDQEESTDPSVYVFCSYDIVESTYLKSINYHWAQLFDHFYDASLRKLSREGFEFWKYVGDEVLFYKKLNQDDLKEFHSIPSRVYEIMLELQKEIHQEFEGTQMFLALKGTLWLAKVFEPNRLEKSNFTNGTNNILIRKHPPLNYLTIPQEYIDMIDFLGPDIDLGFRISNEAIRNQLIVSAEFVILHDLVSEKLDMHTSNLDLNRYKLIKNKRLKGIWHRREYPLVLYRTEWEGRVFEYDEKNYSIEDLNGDVVDFLRAVFLSLGKSSEIQEYYEIIQKTQINFEKPKKIESPVDVHLAAILFNKDGEVLLMKRGEKKSSPDKYDFGCTNLRDNQKIVDSLKEYYDFGEESSLELHMNTLTKKPIPIALYEYEKSNGQLINGLLFTGRIEIKGENCSFHDYEKYEFYNLTEIESFSMSKDSLDNIKLAKEVLGEN